MRWRGEWEQAQPKVLEEEEDYSADENESLHFAQCGIMMLIRRA